MTPTTSTTNPSSDNNLILSTEKIERVKSILSGEFGYIHKMTVQYEWVDVPRVYRTAKSISNWLEGVARDFEVRPSELERIDLRNGKVYRRKSNTPTTNTRNKRKR